jgi:hypothetical protein
MISVCEKCQRIKLNDEAPWSPRPSPNINARKGGFKAIEECDYCDGTIQEDPEVSSVEDKGRTELGDKVPEKAPAREEAGNGSANKDVVSVPKKARGRPPKVKGEAKPEAGRKEISEVSSEAKEPEIVETQKTLSIAKLDDKKAPIADKHHRALVECKKLMGKSLLEYCFHLREIKEKEYFKFYAESWYEYLSMPEIALDDTRARRLIRLVNVKEAMETQLSRHLNLEEISEARLTRDLLPCIDYDEEKGEIKNPKKVEELLDQARTLGHEDWQAEVSKAKPRVGGKKAKETQIATGALKDDKGNIIGQIVSVRANEENHYVNLRIQNSWIPNGPLKLTIE